MQFYRLSYEGHDKIKPLPTRKYQDFAAEIPVLANPDSTSGKVKNTPEQEKLLEKFAKSCGDEAFAWENVFLKPAKTFKDPVKEINWEGFKEALRNEGSLFEYPWSVFERRIEGGYLHAILDQDNRAIATVNLIPKLTDELRTFLRIKDIDPENPPQVYETGAGWIDPQYRGRKVYSQLRNALLEESHANGRLIFSQALGKGASNVNIKEGWTLVNWNQIPFTAALMGWVEQKNGTPKFRLAAGKVIDLPKKGLYLESTRDASHNLKTGKEFRVSHDWSDYHHLWANNMRKMYSLERLIKQQLGISGNSVPIGAQSNMYAQWQKQIEASLSYESELLDRDKKIIEAWKMFSDGPDAVSPEI